MATYDEDEDVAILFFGIMHLRWKVFSLKGHYIENLSQR